MQVQSLSHEDPLVEEMTTHSSIPAWRILWTEEPSGLQSMGSQRVGHDSNVLASSSLRLLSSATVTGCHLSERVVFLF